MAPILGLGSRLTTSSPSAEEVAYSWGVVSMSNDTSATLNTAETYTISFTGNVPVAGVTYTWSITSGDDSNHPHSFTGQGTASATFTYADVGDVTIKCVISSNVIAGDGQSTKTVTVAYNNTYEVRFDAATAYGEFADNTELTGWSDHDGDYTIGAWLKTPASADKVAGAGGNVAFAITHGALPLSFRQLDVKWSISSNTVIGVVATQLVLAGGAAISTVSVSNVANIGYDEMVFVAISYDRSAGQIRAIVGADGSVTDATATFPGTDPNPDLSSYTNIVLNKYADEYYSTSALSEMIFYNRYLSVAEMEDLYNSGTPFDYQADSGDYNFSGTLQHYYRFGDGVDTRTGDFLINDLVNNNDLTIYNGESDS